MDQIQNRKLIYNPLFRVVTTWVGAIVLPILSALIVLVIFKANFSTARQIFADHSYLTTYFEIAGVGLIPVLFSLIGKDDPARYGFMRKGLLKSILLSVLFVILHAVYSYFTSGVWINFESHAFGLDFPANIWYGLLGIFAYGPLEVFFFMWLVDNTSQLIKTKKNANLWGLLITSFAFGLMHIISTQSIANALTVSVIFFILGLIRNFSRNIAGPMIAWTLINGQVFYLAQMLWQ